MGIRKYTQISEGKFNCRIETERQNLHQDSIIMNVHIPVCGILFDHYPFFYKKGVYKKPRLRMPQKLEKKIIKLPRLDYSCI